MHANAQGRSRLGKITTRASITAAAAADKLPTRDMRRDSDTYRTRHHQYFVDFAMGELPLI